MKKLIAMLLAAIMLLSLCACGGQPANNEGGEQETTTAPTVETTDPPPSYAVEEGQVIKFADLYTGENGANGLTYYYTTDGKTLTPFSTKAEGQEGWVYEKGVLVYPVANKADNYGCGGSSDSAYMLMGYEIPETGKVDLFVWTALQGPAGSHGYKVKVALGTLDNVVASYDNIGDTQNVIANTYSIEVTKGETLYMIYEPTVWAEGEWFGYITQMTYTSVG